MSKVKLAKELKAKKKRLKSIEFEIDCYDPKPSISAAMLKAGELGFEFSGHGCGMGSEDFGLVLDYDGGYYYLGFHDYGNKVVSDLTNNEEKTDKDGYTFYEHDGYVYEGRISGLWKHIDKIIAELSGKKK